MVALLTVISPLVVSVRVAALTAPAVHVRVPPLTVRSSVTIKPVAFVLAPPLTVIS